MTFVNHGLSTRQRIMATIQHTLDPITKQIIESKYTLNKEWCLHVKRWPNGKKKSKYFTKNGLTSLMSKHWHSNGKLHWKGHHTNGRLDGLYVKQDSSGFLRERSHWCEGKVHGLAEHWSSALLASGAPFPLERSNWNQGKKHGLAEHWHLPESSINQRDGWKWNAYLGLFVETRDAAILAERSNWVDGKREGPTEK